ATEGIFTDRRTHKRLHLLNTHFDHVGAQARTESAKLLLQRYKTAYTGDAFILMGDFNAEEQSEPIQLFASELEGLSLVDSLFFDGPAGTFNAFAIQPSEERRID
ncbi:hypothetical protein RZS08_63615, partial [Arthrospira platensis SPKY1]|nr:hypothetical protein [Arthrospira platensis SPKY1]